MSDTTSSPRPARWKTWALVASLAINLVVFGAIAGAFLRGAPERYKRPTSDADFGAIVRALPDKPRGDLRDHLRGRGGDFKERRQQFAQMRGEMIAVLRADPFDPAALENLFARQRTALGEMALGGHTVLLETITQMSTADRMTFAKNLSRGRIQGHGERK